MDAGDDLNLIIREAFGNRRKPTTISDFLDRLTGFDIEEVQRLSNIDWENLTPSSVQNFRDAYAFITPTMRLFIAPKLLILALDYPKLILGDNLVSYMCDDLSSRILRDGYDIVDSFSAAEKSAISAWQECVTISLSEAEDRASREISKILRTIGSAVG
ncbi:MAG: hypothetical protein V3V13_08535 [Paracoccaceae bacterium]